MTDSITVMMAAKDCHRTLAKSLSSCLQNLRSDDVVNIFLDGYDAELRRIAESFRDPRVNVFWSEHSIGLLASRQALLDSVKTPFAAVVDSDDYCLPGRFSIPMGAILRGKANMVFGNSAFITENERRKLLFPLASHHENLARALLFGNPLIHSTLTSSSSLLRSVGYRAEYAEDRIMYLDAAKAGARLLLLPTFNNRSNAFVSSTPGLPSGFWESKAPSSCCIESDCSLLTPLSQRPRER